MTAVTVRPSVDTPAANTGFARAVVDWFAEQAAEQVQGQLVHYSQRHALLKTAERLGIGRFHANLIIATAQHNAQRAGTTAVPDQGAGKPARWIIAVLVVALQTGIVWGAWRVMHGV